MALFQDKRGKWHESKPHEASFNGLHNRVKSKALIILFNRYQNRLGGLSAKGISEAAGVKLGSLSGLLTKWVAWGYCNRKAVAGKSGAYYSYTISERGAKFVNLRIPADKLREYNQEIADHVRDKGRKL